MNRIAPLPMSALAAGAQGRGRRRSRVVGAAGAGLRGASTCPASLFLVLNKADPAAGAVRRASCATGSCYADDPPLRKKLRRLDRGCRRRPARRRCRPALLAAHAPRRPLHGDARFATAARGDARRPAWHGRRRRPSILVGRYRGRFLALPGQLSVMLSAPTRSGKGVGVVIPNLLELARLGRRARHQGRELRHHGRLPGRARAGGVRVLAVRRGGAQPPLESADSRAHERRCTGSATCWRSARCSFPNDGSGTSSEAFFNDQARNLFLGHRPATCWRRRSCRARSARCCASPRARGRR